MVRRMLLVAVVFLAAAGSGSADEGGTTCLWRAHKDGATVHLLGSIHMLKETAYPLPAAIETAFSKSSVVVFEVDMDEMTAAAFQMLAAGSIEDGKTLEEAVGPDLWARFETKMSKAGFPVAMFQSMKPWMAALSLMGIELQTAGYSDTAGIDSYFTRSAKEAGKERMALETVDFQIGLFSAFTPDQSLEFFQYTLDDLETLIPMLDELQLKWRIGDVAYLESMLVDEFKEYPDLYGTLVTNRNRAWMPAIEELLAGPNDAMVVVGALHLVGEDGLIEMLRKKGYTVTQQ